MTEEMTKGLCGIFGIVFMVLAAIYYGQVWHEERISILERNLRQVTSEIRCFNAYTGELGIVMKDYEDEYQANRVLRRMLTASQAEIKVLTALLGEKRVTKRLYPPKGE